ncbi:MAG: hypothetical protein QOF80_2090 [Verrucomicrobiota bacterium]|jgi:hypothetical protein
MDFVYGMANKDNTESRQDTEPGSETIRGRLQGLAQKTAALNETLARVEKNLSEASGEANSSGRSD